MFAIAILVGIYSYTLFGLGLLGILTRSSVIIVSVALLLVSVSYFWKHPQDFPKFNLKRKEIFPFTAIFILMATVNFIGVLSPELSFDALWYHLTLPKIFFTNGSINFIPGGLLYYSAMPKLGEMLFIPSISFDTAILAKSVQFFFGILTSLVIYRISREFVDKKLSIIAVLIFYSSLVVAWESTVAYIDLIRTFFESMAMWGFLNWIKKKDKKWLTESGVMLGLAMSTKLIAFGSLIIFSTLFVYLIFSNRKNIKDLSLYWLYYLAISVSIVLPWLIFSYVNTKSVFYPLFSDLYKIDLSFKLLNPITAVKDFFNLFVKSDDPISPIYAIILPLSFVFYKKLSKDHKLMVIYSLVALIVWYFTPRTGGGRFILPYLPVFSVFSVILLGFIKYKFTKIYILVIIILVSFSTVLYRGIANVRSLPVILGLENKNEYMAKKLNFNYGDFYDTDGFFAKNIKNSDKVLLYGFHNLYYVNFPYVHESFIKPGDQFNFIATQNSLIPDRFSNWERIYHNSKTNVSVYSLGGIMWSY